MEVKFYSNTGDSKGTYKVSDELFGAIPNIPLLRQYVHVYRTNQRQGTVKTKTRAEVSGGGKKPWAQKHTGRARHGSIRSPIWRHGGVALGPRPRPWSLKLPKRMRALALKSALSLKASAGAVKVVEKPVFEKPSTKSLGNLLAKIKSRGRVLLVQADNDLILRKSASNINKLNVALAQNLSTYDVLLAEHVIFTPEAISTLEEKYAHK